MTDVLEARAVSCVYRRGAFSLHAEAKRAVSDVSLTVMSGEIHALVGESGSGKSTLGRMLLRLLPPTEGQIAFNDADVWAMPRAKVFDFRAHVQGVFQDPAASFDPRQRIGRFLSEGFHLRRDLTASEKQEQVRGVLEAVNLPGGITTRFPHQVSGGQRQRLALARSLLSNPSLLVLDEPVSALDVVVQSQVTALLKRIQSQTGVGMLLITHDLAICRHVAGRVSVMKGGSIVESGDARQIFTQPAHPYTSSLLAAAGLDLELPRLPTESTLAARGEVQ